MQPLWINAGELSGDIQAGAVLREIRQMRPDLAVIGMGGPNLAAAGQKNLFNVNDLSIMGLSEVITAIPRALRLLGKIKIALQETHPCAVVLVDAPEFNFRVAAIASQLEIPVYYFIPPKVWAWRTYRVKYLQKYIRKLFCILPFEPNFYRKHGLNVDYVGNPLVGMVNWEKLKEIDPEKGRIGFMPGSRCKEIEALLPIFAKTAELLATKYGSAISFHCLRAPNISEDALRSLWQVNVPIVFDQPEDRYVAMRKCRCLLAASGTATLETGLAGVPTVVSYKVTPISAFLGRRLIKVPWVSLTNLIMEREVFPEFLQEKATPENMAKQVEHWLDDTPKREALLSDLEILRQRCGSPNSASIAATHLLKELDELPQK